LEIYTDDDKSREKRVVNRELRESLAQEALAYYERVEELESMKAYGQAIELLTKLILLKEFEANCISCYGVSSAPYKELAHVFRLAHDAKSELEILERFFLQPNIKGNSKEEMAIRYLSLAKELNYHIPEHIRATLDEIHRESQRQLALQRKSMMIHRRSQRGDKVRLARM
jgi:hypothetical protein